MIVNVDTLLSRSKERVVNSSTNQGRLPGLDGLRAVSIAGVLAVHCSETSGFPSLGPLDFFIRNGGFGVDIFFVLSGFLITSLLLKEENRFGSFSISAFYLRRCIRILPPALAYLTAMLLAGFIGLTGVTFTEWAEAAGFSGTMSVKPGRRTIIGPLPSRSNSTLPGRSCSSYFQGDSGSRS